MAGGNHRLDRLLGAIARLAVGVAFFSVACSPADTPAPDPVGDELAARFLRVVAAEDARPSSGPELELLLRAAGGAETGTAADSLARLVAIRALGRLEDPGQAGQLLGYLDDADPEVRGHAADALAQALFGHDGSVALEPLLARAEGGENDPRVLGVVARSLGRLRLGEDDRARILPVLSALTRDGDADAGQEQMKGAVLGMESLARAGTPFDNATVDRLGELTLYGRLGDAREPDAGRVRALAVSVLARIGELETTRLEPALRDSESAVRITAAQAIPAAGESARDELVRRALRDPVVGVRVAALRTVAASARDELACLRLFAGAVQDESRVVRLEALDALATPCPVPEGQLRILLDAASRLGPETIDDWQVPARALASLASFAPGHARRLLPTFLGHPNELVRAQAARAASIMEDEELLGEMAATDPGANARFAALEGLARLAPVPVELLLEQLGSDDPQLLMLASRLLGRPAGSARSDSVESATGDALVRTFERISAARRETWRDARMALLDAMAELGGNHAGRHGTRLATYATDYDPVVAERIVELLDDWGEDTPSGAEPVPLARLPLPTAAELNELELSLVHLQMRRGGTIVIQPLPHLATTNAHRFVRLAREGYFDGLTLHRAEPNFVIQGGSPGANEYAGDGPYTRDEVGLLPHWRGTVGLSTRGRDTGDAQIFINLAHNVRLNHNYTIFGVVTDGIEVVDEVVAGDVIERAEVRVAPAAPGS